MLDDDQQLSWSRFLGLQLNVHQNGHRNDLPFLTNVLADGILQHEIDVHGAHR